MLGGYATGSPGRLHFGGPVSAGRARALVEAANLRAVTCGFVACGEIAEGLVAL